MATAAEQRERAQQRRAEDAARLGNLYGSRLDDVRVLQRRGFVVTKEGGDFMVGNKLVDGATLSAMADRERRLEGTMETATRTNGHDGSSATDTCKCGKPIRHRGSCWARRGLSGPPQKGGGAGRRKKKEAAPSTKPQRKRRVAGTAGDVAGIDALIAKLQAEVERLQGVIAGLQMAKDALRSMG